MADEEGPIAKAGRELMESMRHRSSGEANNSRPEQPEQLIKMRDGGIGFYPPPEPGTTDLSEPGMFVSNDGLIINWLGENYYKSCSEKVVDGGIEAGSSFCVKREGHPNEHEDYHGIKKSSDICVLCKHSMDDHMVLTTSLTVDDRAASVPSGWLCPRKDDRRGRVSD